MTPHIALLGLGLMGRGMAGRLLEAGFPLTIYNRSQAKCRDLADRGAVVASSPKEAATHGEIIISMVADDVASRSVWLGEEGAMSSVAAGSVLIESSTLTVPWVRELASAAACHGCELLDAPVTGSRDHAASGELRFLVGGEASTLERVRPVLAAMSGSIMYLGPQGSGALVKLINNGVCGVQCAALAQALALIEKSGIDPAPALSVLTEGAPASPLVKAVSGRMTAKNYDPHFVLRLMMKDLAYALGAAERHEQSFTLAAAALSVFQGGVAAGDGDLDFSAVVEQFR